MQPEETSLNYYSFKASWIHGTPTQVFDYTSSQDCVGMYTVFDWHLTLTYCSACYCGATNSFIICTISSQRLVTSHNPPPHSLMQLQA